MAAGCGDSVNALMIGGIVGALFGLVAAELLDLSAWIAPRIVRLATRNFPTAELKIRYEEEWLSELAHYDGLKLAKLGKALAILGGSHRTASIYLGDDFVYLRTYLSRLLAIAPPMLRYAWSGQGVGSAPLFINFAAHRLIDEDPDMTIFQADNGQSRAVFDLDAQYSRPVSLAVLIVRKAVVGPLCALHQYRSLRTEQLPLNVRQEATEFSVQWLLRHCKSVTIPDEWRDQPSE